MSEQTIFRAPKDCENKFTRVSNKLISDQRLSVEARFTMVYLLSKPDDWQVMPEDLQREFEFGREKTYKVLAELKDTGYLTREKIRGERQRIGWGPYKVYECPIEVHDTPDQDTAHQDTADQNMVDQDTADQDLADHGTVEPHNILTTESTNDGELTTEGQSKEGGDTRASAPEVPPSPALSVPSIKLIDQNPLPPKVAAVVDDAPLHGQQRERDMLSSIKAQAEAVPVIEAFIDAHTEAGIKDTGQLSANYKSDEAIRAAIQVLDEGYTVHEVKALTAYKLGRGKDYRVKFLLQDLPWWRKRESQQNGSSKTAPNYTGGEWGDFVVTGLESPEEQLKKVREYSPMWNELRDRFIAEGKLPPGWDPYMNVKPFELVIEGAYS